MSAQLATVLPLLPEPAARGFILHVDDDEGVRLSTGMLLRSAGFDTREASSGETALAQVETLRGRLDVLIVDYDLGRGMTGTELAEEFARLLGHAVPTVMLTARRKSTLRSRVTGVASTRSSIPIARGLVLMPRQSGISPVAPPYLCSLVQG